MANYGTWIVARSDEPLSKTRVVQGLPSIRGGEVDDLATEPGWSAAWSDEPVSAGWYGGDGDTPALVRFVEELAAELDAPVVAGWCEDGDVLAGCFSGDESDPLLFAINLDEQTAESCSWGPDYLAELRDRWGVPWQDGAAAEITRWLAGIDPGIEEGDVREVFEDEFALANDGLFALLELVGLRWDRNG